MRRPEDYVPLTSVQAGKAPRKSTLKPAHFSSSSSATSTQGLNSLPRSSSGSVKPLSASGGAPTPSAAASESDDEPDDVLPPRKSKAGQEMEERRRERALGAAQGAPAKIGRRHSVAV